MEFEHYLITRFNLAVKFDCPQRDDTKLDKPWIDFEYLKGRFLIFEQYTVPSICNQTLKEFRWLVLFHKDTPDYFKEKIRDVEKICANFIPLYLDDNESANFLSFLDSYLEKHCRADYLITSRVDNDDSLSLDYIETIQKFIMNRSLTNSIISMEHGVQYYLKSKLAFNYFYRFNHFLSQVVPISATKKSIYHYNHALLDEYEVDIQCIRRSILCHPYWVEIIHESNYSNDLKLYPSSLVLDYGIKRWHLFIDWNIREYLTHLVLSAKMICIEDLKKIARRLHFCL